MTGPGSATLRAQVTLDRPGFRLAADLEIPAGQVLAVVGPNAAGKSTLLQILAGLVRPTSGSVRLGDRVLTGAGTQVPPERRGIGLLGQDPLLFDHLSVTENVAFGLRAAGMRRHAARAAADRWLARVGLPGLAERRPGSLSGGQAQRVALARALAAEPEVLLLDEPLAALDAQTAPEIRQLLGDQLRSTATTAIVVSHDVLDAALLADQIAVLAGGEIVEHGPVAQVLTAPTTAFTAALVGVTLVPGERHGDGVYTAWGTWPVAEMAVPSPIAEGSPCVVRIRPAAITVSPPGENGTGGVEGRVAWLEPAAGGVRVRVTGAGAVPGGEGPASRGERPDLLADVDPARVDPAWLAPGAVVRVHVDPQRLTARPL